MPFPVRTALVTTLVVAATAGISAPAHAGDERPAAVYATYSVSTQGATTLTSATVVSQKVGRPARTAQAVGDGTGIRFSASVSADGRVMSVLRVTGPTSMQDVRLIVRVDGRAVMTSEDVLSWPHTADDGSSVTWVAEGGRVRSYDVSADRTRTLCRSCASGASYAAPSPDGRFLAIRASFDNDNAVDIIRLSDSAVVASWGTTLPWLDLSIAWRPDSTKVAFTDLGTQTEPHPAIVVMGIDGTRHETAFRAPSTSGKARFYASPAWLDGRVWAVRVVQLDQKRARIDAVSARSWAQRPTTAPRPLRTINSDKETFGLLFMANVAWSTARPAT